MSIPESILYAGVTLALQYTCTHTMEGNKGMVTRSGVIVVYKFHGTYVAKDYVCTRGACRVR